MTRYKFESVLSEAGCKRLETEDYRYLALAEDMPEKYMGEAERHFEKALDDVNIPEWRAKWMLPVELENAKKRHESIKLVLERLF